MNAVMFTRWLAIAGMCIGTVGILMRIKDIMNRPFKADLSKARGDERRGILYAFTLGMAPWEKESTRIHWLAYLRGIFFHVGIFVSFGVLIFSPWLGIFPDWLIWLTTAFSFVGAILGFAGIWIRLHGENERALSLPDDYFSVLLTSVFILLSSFTLLYPAVLPYFYIAAGLMCAYIPISKIRHCVYFFYTKFFYGKSYGHRGVIGQAHE